MPIAVTETAFLFLASLVMSSFVVANAYMQKQQFYPLVVYITKSNASMAIIYIQGLVMVLLLGKLIRKIFFGQLRTAEMEHLIERSWYAVTETCLAFTVFRDDLSPKFVALFTLLLFLKCFHWLAEDRVDYMERSPNISFLFHVRVVSLLSILGLMDATFVYMAYYSTLTKGASVQLVFGFEYAILFAIIINIAMKYVLHFFDLYNENPWEDKAIYLLYTELIMGFFKIGLYFVFIVIMMKIHTFPLFAIRPMYLTMRGFKKALNDVIMSRRAIRNMNTLYPDATTQDIENSDNVCIICRENMVGNGSCKKLPCNHIFHVTCLRSWFQRQQTCPTCRMDVLRTNSATNAANANNDANNNANNQNNNNNANAPAAAAAAANANIANALNGQIPPIFAAHPIMFQHFQQFFQHPNQNEQNNNNNAGNSNNASSNPSTSASAAASTSATFPSPLPTSLPIPPSIFPFLQSPPFPMPQLPVSALLQGLSDQELRLFEGTERQNLEAKIKCLNEVKTLISSATIRLQQYNNVLINSVNKANVSTQTEQFESSTTIPNISSPKVDHFLANNVPNATTSVNSADSTTSPTSTSPNSASSSAPLTNDGGDQFKNDDKELIRLRRLQHFFNPGDGTPATNTTPTTAATTSSVSDKNSDAQTTTTTNNNASS